MQKTKSRLSKKQGKKHARQSRRNIKSGSKNRYSGMLGDGCPLFSNIRDEDYKKIIDKYGNYKYDKVTMSNLPCYSNDTGEWDGKYSRYTPDEMYSRLGNPNW
jgi:hypothetical protein